MEKYLGVKLIEAEPMTHGEFAKEKYGENQVETQFATENKHTEGYKVKYSDDYISWSPKKAFEESYRPINGLNFGLAVEGLKKGHRLQREGWNGKGMYVYYVPENSYKAVTESAKNEFGEMVPYNPYFAIKNVNDTVSTWVPSINDCLAEDWQIVK